MTNIDRFLPEGLSKFVTAAACAALVGMGASTVCTAQPYVVLKGGQSQWEDFDGDDKDTFVALGAGFNIGKYFSVEVAYNDLGEVSADEDDTLTADAYSTSVAGYLRWPMFQHFGWFLKAGLESWKADVETPEFDDRAYGTGSFAGVGAQASFGQVDVSVFYELHKLDEKGKPLDGEFEYDDFDIDIVGAGVAYRF